MTRKNRWLYATVLCLLVFILLIHISVLKTPVTEGSLDQQTVVENKGIWRNYFDIRIREIAFESDYIWAATSGGVLRWNREDGSYVHYTTADGLAHNNVSTVFIDRSGNKWFGTEWGISKFDDHLWTSIDNLEGVDLFDIAEIREDDSGNIWFGCKGEFGMFCGLIQFDGSTWIAHSGIDSHDFGDYGVRGIEIQDGKYVLAATSVGLWKFDGQRWSELQTPFTTSDGSFSPDFYDDVVIDRSGNIWTIKENKILNYDGLDWHQYSTADGLPDRTFISLQITGKGDIWVTTFMGYEVDQINWILSVSEFDGVGWKPVQGELIDSNSFPLEREESNVLWFQDDGQLIWLDGSDSKLYPLPEGPIGNQIKDIYIDKAGRKYFATGGGASVFDGEKWFHYTKTDGLADDNVNSIFVDLDGTIWFGTYKGLSAFDGKEWKTFTTNDGLAGNSINVINADSDGSLWCGTAAGISRFDGIGWTSYTTDDGLLNNWVSTIVPDPDGGIWVGTGTMYSGNQDGGLSKFDGHNWISYGFGDKENYLWINSLVFDGEGMLWAGTSQGLFSFDGTVWVPHLAESGIDFYFEDLAIDQSGNFWMSDYHKGCPEGFGCLNGIRVVKYDGKEWVTHTHKDGLAYSLINAIAVDINGHIWFGTRRGVSEFVPFSSIKGSILDPQRKPISNVNVSAGIAAITVTGLEDIYQIDGLEPASYTTRPQLDGHTFFPLSQTVALPPDAAGVDFVGMPGIDFRPAPDGYHDKNYGGANLEDYKMSDMQLMFGDKAVCYMDGDECAEYKQAAMEWNIEANQSMKGGHCDGMATTSLRLFQDLDYSPIGNAVYELDIDDPLVATHWSGDTFNTTVRRNIAYYFVEQLTDPVSSYANTIIKRKPSEILTQLVESFSQEPSDPVSLFILKKISISEMKGHAITPYAAEDKGNGIYWIRVYDNNYPGDDSHHVIINTQDDSWEYDMGGDWGIWKGDASTRTLGIVPISVYAARPECPWCIGIPFLRVHYSSESREAGGGLLITNTAGERLGVGEDAFLSEIPGAYEFVINDLLEVAGYPYYVLPVEDAYTIQIKGDPQADTEGASVTQFGSGYAAEVRGISLSPGARDVLTIASDGSQLTYQAGEDKEIQIVLAVDGEAEGYQFTLNGIDLESGQTFSLQFDRDSEELNVSNGSIADNNGYDIEIVQVSAQGEQRADYYDIEMANGETHAYDVGQLGGRGDAPMTVRGSKDQSTGETQEESTNAAGGSIVLIIIALVFILGMILTAAGLYFYFRKS